MSWIKRNKNWKVFIILGAIILLMIPFIGMFSIENIKSVAYTSLPLTVLVFLAIYVLKAFVIVIPIPMLYVAAGIVFPTGGALAISYLFLTVTLSIGYLVGKRLGEEKLRKLLEKQKKVAGFLDGRTDNLSSLCFVYRLLPLPFDLLNMFCGAIQMPFSKYIFISLLGVSPTVIPAVLIGEAISYPMSAEFLLPFGISLVFALLGFVAYRGWARSSVSKAKSEPAYGTDTK